jgi:hypothetical protein
VRDLGGLVALLESEDTSRDAERAIARIGPAAVQELAERFSAASSPGKACMVRTMGRFASDPAIRDALVEGLRAGDPITRRRAATALGHARGSGAVELALLEAWTRDPDPALHRRIAESLGKAGTGLSLPTLRDAVGSPDPEISRIAEKAVARIERTVSRPGRGSLDPTRTPSGPTAIALRARRGIGRILVDELREIRDLTGVRELGSDQVTADLRGPMQSLEAARTMLSFEFRLPREVRREGESLGETIARSLAGRAARDVLTTWTSGTIRYRLAWGDGRHRRAATWEVVQAIGRENRDWVNDPTASLWEFRIGQSLDSADVALLPRALVDPRFPWRVADVPAASHPTLAAALARIAGGGVDDIVWDPFVGSAGELIERSLRGPVRALIGTDTDPRAISAARANLDAAGVLARIEQADALATKPEGVTLILTNPPMGRRASRHSGIVESLDRFVTHAAEVLVPGGRLVWVAPWPSRARAIAERCGLTIEWAADIDMGGFDAQLQRFRK